MSDDIVIGPMPHAHTPPAGDKQTRAAQIQAAFLCGVINAIITIPVMTSFAAIIFQASTSHHTMIVSQVTAGHPAAIASSSKQYAGHVHLRVPTQLIWLSWLKHQCLQWLLIYSAMA